MTSAYFLNGNPMTTPDLKEVAILHSGCDDRPKGVNSPSRRCVPPSVPFESPYETRPGF
ncbi:hypothetical protein M407DRAFT_244669 [Tulasnella calospora MUT 4182]|uniref:Uncharacterized protein n=1 Tax=Tulasnella calospora MUT 4182 TaxID=1051891 RepID=A0A0C3Q4D3_9AGAM|nr:hypothetical protein M407DRAFT_244669 [Tulasnella calospora MUT 4182]